MDRRAQIESLHALYGELTGNRLFLSMERERDWFDWLRFNPQEPFTADDLRLVVPWLRKQIKADARRHASLNFRNLIAMPERFDEDRSDARSAARVQPPAPRRVTVRTPDGATERQIPGDATAAATKKAGEVLASPAFQEFCNLKGKL